MSHGGVLYDHQLLVPLIVHLPATLKRVLASEEELSGRVIEQQVSLVDLVPTILDLLGMAQASAFEGRSLRPLLEGEGLPPVDAFAEHINKSTREDKALRTQRYKFIYSYPTSKKPKARKRERIRLYDLLEDPSEQVNVAELHPELVAGFEARLAVLRGGKMGSDVPNEVPAEFDREEMDSHLEDQLRELGYIE
jgi:arylsulfatase A-like enzyme